MDREKFVDESWKDHIDQEKSKEEGCGCGGGCHKHEEHDAEAEYEVNFFNYITSLAFQALIFLGEMGNPMEDNKVTPNPKQAKFIIDTLLMIREKTKGNLSREEEELLNASLYELQMKFIQRLQSPDAPIQGVHPHVEP